jgi:hypothetical protein
LLLAIASGLASVMLFLFGESLALECASGETARIRKVLEG